MGVITLDNGQASKMPDKLLSFAADANRIADELSKAGGHKCKAVERKAPDGQYYIYTTPDDNLSGRRIFDITDKAGHVWECGELEEQQLANPIDATHNCFWDFTNPDWPVWTVVPKAAANPADGEPPVDVIAEALARAKEINKANPDRAFDREDRAMMKTILTILANAQANGKL
jgi:hypothetical protein